MTRKYTGKDVGEMVDFGGNPHGPSPYTRNATGRPCPCDCCVKARREIAESLSLDGTMVNGIFTATEIKSLKDWAIGKIEDEVYFGGKR